MKVVDSSVQGQDLLRSFSPLESLLLSFLTPCRTMRLLDQGVTARCRNHLLVVDIDKAREFPDRGPITPELIGTDCVWDSIVS